MYTHTLSLASSPGPQAVTKRVWVVNDFLLAPPPLSLETRLALSHAQYACVLLPSAAHYKLQHWRWQNSKWWICAIFVWINTNEYWRSPLVHTEAPLISWYQSSAIVIPCYSRGPEWREQNEILYTPSMEIDKQQITVLNLVLAGAHNEKLVRCLDYT